MFGSYIRLSPELRSRCCRRKDHRNTEVVLSLFIYWFVLKTFKGKKMMTVQDRQTDRQTDRQIQIDDRQVDRK